MKLQLNTYASGHKCHIGFNIKPNKYRFKHTIFKCIETTQQVQPDMQNTQLSTINDEAMQYEPDSTQVKNECNKTTRTVQYATHRNQGQD